MKYRSNSIFSRWLITCPSSMYLTVCLCPKIFIYFIIYFSFVCAWFYFWTFYCIPLAYPCVRISVLIIETFYYFNIWLSYSLLIDVHFICIFIHMKVGYLSNFIKIFIGIFIGIMLFVNYFYDVESCCSRTRAAFFHLFKSNFVVF